MPENEKIPQVVVVGQLARDIVLAVDAMPAAGAAADVRERRETLGGKGANQAVAVVQLGASAVLVAVAGDDVIGDALLAQAKADGVDVSGVVRRRGALTGLIVEALEADGSWRYLQHLPEEVLLTPADVERMAIPIRRADAVMLQLQQPAAAIATAAKYARQGQKKLIVLDGVPEPDVLAVADVLRADEREARLATGGDGDAGKLLEAGPGLVALGRPDGNLFVWDDPRWGSGELLIPLADGSVVDTTGAGDAFTAALTVSLVRGDGPEVAARHAVDAATSSVGHPGGRPTLKPW